LNFKFRYLLGYTLLKLSEDIFENKKSHYF